MFSGNYYRHFESFAAGTVGPSNNGPSNIDVYWRILVEAIRVQAKFCLVAPDRLLAPAQLLIRHGRVVEIVQGRPCAADVDLGEMLLIPGLINAHTHLEFSGLKRPFAAGVNFPDWISQVVRSRAAQPAVGDGQHSQAALHMGLQEAFATGTAVIGDIVTAPWMPPDYPSAQRFVRSGALWSPTNASESQAAGVPVNRLGSLTEEDWRAHILPISYPRVMPFTELIGMSAERAAASWQWSQAATAATGSELAIGCGVSPHAPYSIHFPSIATACNSLPATTPIAMHIAESRDELQWVEQGHGAFGEAFARLGLRPEAAPPTIVECIELLTRFKHALLIHGNYLTKAQVDRIAATRNISVVYCPRTHSHFSHAAYPLQALRDAGVRVVLGTDSRASNPSLSLWDEVTHAACQHPHREPSEWLRSVTLNSAEALGIADDFGSLLVGRWASAVAIPARADWSVANLFEALCASSAQELQMQPLARLLGQI